MRKTHRRRLVLWFLLTACFSSTVVFFLVGKGWIQGEPTREPSQSGIFSERLWYRSPEQLTKYCHYTSVINSHKHIPKMCQKVNLEDMLKRRPVAGQDTFPTLQKQDGECKLEFYAYRAYYEEKRSTLSNNLDAKVTVTGFLQAGQVGYAGDMIYCYLWYPNSTSSRNHASISVAKVAAFGIETGRFQAVQIQCTLPRDATDDMYRRPQYVSLHYESCSLPNNFMRIAQSITHDTIRNTGKAMCSGQPKFKNGTITGIKDWVETFQAFGISSIHLYSFGENAERSVDFEQFRLNGLITLHDFDWWKNVQNSFRTEETKLNISYKYQLSLLYRHDCNSRIGTGSVVMDLL